MYCHVFVCYCYLGGGGELVGFSFLLLLLFFVFLADEICNEKHFCLDFRRLQPHESFFDTLPPLVNDVNVKYTTACECSMTKENDVAECRNAFDVAIPTVKGLKKGLEPIPWCNQQKREVHLTDDLTDDDFRLFNQAQQLHPRYRREIEKEQISKENATYYCAERISKTEIGKLCAKVGVNVQALVNTCAVDLEVRKPYFFLILK